MAIGPKVDFFWKKNKPWNLASKIPSRTVKFGTIFEKIILPLWFWKMSGKSSTYRKNKTHKNFFCIYHYSYIYTYIPKVYTILLLRDLKNQKVGPLQNTKFRVIFQKIILAVWFWKIVENFFNLIKKLNPQEFFLHLSL